MTYDAEKIKYGKQAVQIVELHLERCSRTYGVAPCTAAVGVSGTKKCFNTFGTCQDTANFNSVPVVYRFATTRLNDYAAHPVNDPPIFPTLTSVDTAPTILTPGKGLGVRSSVKATLVDHPWTDVLFDPYRTDRAYNPDAQGSFWGKFLARNKHYVNRKMVVKTGFLNDDGEYEEANFKSRTYVITKISGPGANGAVTIEAKDPLRLADNEKVKWPTPSKAVTAVSLTTGTTTFTITDADDVVKTQLSVGSLAQPYLRIDKEIVRVTSWSGTGTLTVTVVRGSVPTFYDATFNVIAAHDAGALVQTTWLYNAALAYDVVDHLLGDVAALDPAYLPYAEWQAEIDNGFNYMTFSRLIVEPTGVKDLLTELTEHGLMLWWDERASVVRMRGMRFYALFGDQLNDSDHLIANSVAVTDDTASLATQVWINYALAAPLEDPKQLKSYRQLEIKVDLDAEAAEAYGRPSVMMINSKWMPLGGGVTFQSQVLLRQYAAVRKIITFALDPKDDAFWVGDVVGVATHLVQDDEGLPTARNYLITSVDEVWSADGVTLKYTATEQFNYTRAGVIAPEGLPDYSAASTEQRNRYAFISRDIPSTGPTMTDGTPAYQIL